MSPADDFSVMVGRLNRLSVEEPSLEVIYTRYFEDQGVRHAA